MNFQLEEILTVIDHVKAADLALFEYQDMDVRIKIEGKQGTEPDARMHKMLQEDTMPYKNGIQSHTAEECVNRMSERNVSAEQPQDEEKTASHAQIYTQDSPMVGTFYAAPSEDAEPFVKAGDIVKKGQTIGIIEAMKLMNEINADCSGVVEAIIVENEQMVEYGQPLIRIRQEQE